MITVAVSATPNRSRNWDNSCGTAVKTLQAAIPIDLGNAALSLAAPKSMEMAKDFIGYQALTDAALRGVVRDALRRIEKSGLIGSHHFYLTFKTQYPGVAIPDFLREQYPEEMTVILQHQFWGLRVKDDGFEVTLTFKKLPATLSVPFAALTAFFDPGVQFGLQFRGEQGGAKLPLTPAGTPSQLISNIASPEESKEKKGPSKPSKAERDEPEKPQPHPDADVVSLDSFRKK
jgi:uncharacterized protein